MIRLNVYCSVVPSPKQTRLKSSHRPWLIGCRRAHSPLARVSIKAVMGESDGGNSSYPSQSWDPGLEVQVPYEQRPVNEYSSLKDGTLYSWGELGPGPFFIRLGGLWLVTFTTLGVPIAAASFNPSRDPLRFVLAAGTGTLFLVSLIVLRIYLGWSYVGDRLLSAVIPYEESGWYDGQMWAKPPEILARDRLIGSSVFSHVLMHLSVLKFIDRCSFRGLDNDMLKQLDTYLFPQVKPVIKMLKQTLVGTGAILVTAVLLFTFATPIEEFFQNTFSMKGKITEPVSDISTKYNIRREELLRLPMEVKTDDDLAVSAAQAADGRPV